MSTHKLNFHILQSNDKISFERFLAGLSHQLIKQHRIQIIARDAQQADAIDALLWNEPAEAFMPHSLASDPLCPNQAITISHKLEDTPCEAVIVCDCENMLDSDQIVHYIVDQNPQRLQASRTLYKNFKQQGKLAHIIKHQSQEN